MFAVKAIRHTITAHGGRTSEGNNIQYFSSSFFYVLCCNIF